ncbi:MAG: RnfABCDGE type electron transport complex subunit D, partial [Dehalococcoidales bacterium]|nr:RnfABCDGE type electron transport complex subunit D [Dehalococcoidales bacterium]
AAVALTSLAFGADPVFNLLAGGVMFAAFYFAVDPVTTPMYWKGKLIFAAGAGILTVLIRQLGSAPDGVAYAILIMNAVTPLIDRYIKPIPMGMKKAKRNEA